jgi:hypothetical protein
MFEKSEEIKLPIISTTNTGGLTDILQLIDTTSNEVFTIKDSTSGTEIIQIVLPQIEKHEERG